MEGDISELAAVTGSPREQQEEKRMLVPETLCEQEGGWEALAGEVKCR